MIIIIGAGLSGLLTGYRLKKAGIPFKILEARDRVGGRINTVLGTNNTPVEMGATWFTNQHQHLIVLLEELEIGYFEQYMDSSVFYQNSLHLPAQQVQIPNQPASYRISGGTSNLINTLYDKLDKEDVLFNQSVRSIIFDKSGVQVNATESFECDQVVLALSPKLWAKNILFEPNLPIELKSIAEQTHTWMEDSIKVALTYTQPFWQQENIPATLFSNTGPITELYDHSNQERSKYALCGFIDSSFKSITYEERRSSVINQLKSVFGASAEEFIEYKECVWSKEENTFTQDDIFLAPHQNNGHPTFSQSFFDDKLFISSAESAAVFPGYMDGAVYSGNQIAEKIPANL